MSTPLNNSVLKAFSILRLITHERTEISSMTVATELGMTNATAHRLLLTLEEAAVLVSYRRGYFTLGPVIEELGIIAGASNQITAGIRPLINELAIKLGESVMVCRLGRNGPTCIAVAASSRAISINIDIGTSLSMTHSAQGKLFLAGMKSAEQSNWLKDGQECVSLDLDQIVTDGFARNRGEVEPDIGALAVPIKNQKGDVVLTLSAFGMLRRFEDAIVERALPEILETAQKIRSLIVRL